MRLIHSIRCEFDEAYRIQTGFGLSPIRDKRELKALIKFCKYELNELEIYNLGSSFKEVWQQTIELYNEAKLADATGEPHNKFNKLNHYIIEHAGCYWS